MALAHVVALSSCRWRTHAVVDAEGVPGRNSDAGRAAFDHEVLSHHPDYVIIYFGLNDALDQPSFVPLDRFIENMGWMVDHARAAGTQPVICTIHHISEKPLFEGFRPEWYSVEGPNAKIDRYNAALRQFAAVRRVPLVEWTARADASSTPVLAMDGVHLTALGSRLLAEAVADAGGSSLRAARRIVCFGDSITAGFGLPPEQSYPRVLEELLAASVRARPQPQH